MDGPMSDEGMVIESGAVTGKALDVATAGCPMASVRLSCGPTNPVLASAVMNDIEGLDAIG